MFKIRMGVPEMKELWVILQIRLRAELPPRMKRNSKKAWKSTV